MSKFIDPESMSPEDVVYVQQRSTLHREFQLQGLGDPTKKGYDGHDFDWDTYFDENGKLRKEPLENPESELEEEEEESEEESEDDELPAEKQWHADMTKKELDEVIAARNADYDDDEQIVIAKDDKPSRIAALEQDDADLAAEDEEDTEE